MQLRNTESDDEHEDDCDDEHEHEHEHSPRGTRLKVLWFDHNGYCILYKRMHAARFELPDSRDISRPIASIDARRLAQILRGVEE